MNTLSLIRPVLVKVIVTENYKMNAMTDLQEAARQVELKLQHLDYQEKHLLAELTKKNPAGVPAARQQIQQERWQYEEKKREVIRRLQEIDGMTLGTEVVYGQMESLTEIKEGDLWQPVLGAEIILRDGVIIEIRKSTAAPEGNLP